LYQSEPTARTARDSVLLFKSIIEVETPLEIAMKPKEGKRERIKTDDK